MVNTLMRSRSSYPGVIVSICVIVILQLHKEAIWVSSTSTSPPNLREAAHDSDPNDINVLPPSFSNVNRRHLSLLTRYSDPRTVKVKTANNDESSKIDEGGSPRPLKILAFGGSVTWGAKLSNRFEQSYPMLLGAPYFDHVDNFSIRATGADYPSLCLNSILSESPLMMAMDEEESYDLILLEFLMNGMKGLPQLLQRLKRRYPDAVIVIVQLWSLSNNIVERDTNRTVHELGRDPSIQWQWIVRKKQHLYLRGLQDFVEQHVQGYVYNSQRPRNPMDAIDKGWFHDDWQHLSESGHAQITADLIRFLSSDATIVKRLTSTNKRVTIGTNKADSLEYEDQCYNWLESGRVPSKPDFHYEGANLRDILNHHPQQFKWVLEFSNTSGGGIIAFHSRSPTIVPLTLAYMTREEPKLYPLVAVSVNGANPIVLNPNEFDIPASPTAHVVRLSEIGWAVPGKNNITITPLEKSTDPFRIAGLIMHGGIYDEQDEGVEHSIIPLGYGSCDHQRAILKIYHSPKSTTNDTILFLPGGPYTAHQNGLFSVSDYTKAGFDVAVLYHSAPRDPIERLTTCKNMEKFFSNIRSAVGYLKKQKEEGEMNWNDVISNSGFFLSWLPTR